MTPLFDRIYAAFDWRPIKGCPGRFVVTRALDLMAPAEVVASVVGSPAGETAAVHTRLVDRPGADGIVLTRFLDGSGGLLTYVKTAGFVHTLNMPDGWRRKLHALGVEG